MEIERVEPREVSVRPRKYAREVSGIILAKDKDFYYWIDYEKHKLHKFDRKNKQNFSYKYQYTGVLYMITNDINDKLYIGETSGTMKDRYTNHLACVKDIKNKKPLYEDMRKYGVEHFKVEKIADVVCCSHYSLVDIENHLIRFFNSQSPNGYNLRCGMYTKHFDRLWRNIYSITLNEDNKYYNVIKKFIDEKFQMDNWDYYKNFDLSVIEDEEDCIKKNESITIEIRRTRPQEEIKSTKIICAYNSHQQDRQKLEDKLIKQFKTKLKNILDQKMEYSKLNHK